MSCRQLNLDIHFDNIYSFYLDNQSIPQLDNFEAIVLKKDMVLGKRIELFFKAFIDQSKRYSIIASEIQIISNKLTLGEFDFLLTDRVNKQQLHVELACKFYLHLDGKNTDNINLWIGPNKRDSLINKIQKLKTKQFPLLHALESQEVLAHLTVEPNAIVQELCFKAFLFVPFRNLDHDYKPTFDGAWLSLGQFLSYFKRKQAHYFIPEKQDWIMKPRHCSTWTTFETIKKKLEIEVNNKKSPMLWVKTENALYHRIFVVWW